MTKEKKVPKTKKSLRPVIVTTAHRGVFFGYATDVSGETIFLRRARLVGVVRRLGRGAGVFWFHPLHHPRGKARAGFGRNPANMPRALSRTFSATWRASSGNRISRRSANARA